MKGLLPLRTNVFSIFRGGWMLMRAIAVLSSSIATIASTMLPLFLYSSISNTFLSFLFLFLAFSAFMIHGVLTHAFNDYADDLSGTDVHSEGILSGGSRVIQTGVISSETLWLIGKWLAIFLLAATGLLALLAYYKLAVLLLVGIWAAASYSLPPLQLSYRPFLGEWLSLFPSILFLGVAGAWLILDPLPIWSVQNAVINALFCLAWVMVHHIPDIEGDRQAVPVKKTTVVWFADQFGRGYARYPALIYLLMTGLCAVWLGFDRIWAAGGVVLFASIGIFLVWKINPSNIPQVTAYEKILLLLAIVTALWLGIFI